jgi:hypothetical protein
VNIYSAATQFRVVKCITVAIVAAMTVGVVIVFHATLAKAA